MKEETIANSIQALESSPQLPTAVITAGDPTSFSANFTLYMSFGLLMFGVIVVFIMAYLFKSHEKPELILKTFAVPMIIIFAVLLPLAGFTSEQMTPAIGLLGTIAGYLLGRHEKGKQEDDEEKP